MSTVVLIHTHNTTLIRIFIRNLNIIHWELFKNAYISVSHPFAVALDTPGVDGVGDFPAASQEASAPAGR